MLITAQLAEEVGMLRNQDIKVMKAGQLAREKGLGIAAGTQRRHRGCYQEAIKRIQDGAIGDIVAIHENYLTGTLWLRERQPEWSEMEYQNRNWLYYNWLSGDHIVEQFIHSLDKALWLMGDQPPRSVSWIVLIRKSPPRC